MSQSTSTVQHAKASRSEPVSPSVTESSQLQLTPRSKVQALLADLEDDSDDDSPLKETGSTSILPLSEISLNARPGSRQDSGVHEEDQPVKPRGSLASRLFASSRRDSANSTTKVREENAYERIKKQLLGGQQEDSTKPDQAQSMADSREDEEDAPIRSRKRQHHVSTAIESEGEVLQSPNVHVGNSSGLFLSPGTSPIRKERDKSLADPISDLEDSEAELPEEPGKNIRFLELVQRKKQERLEKEAREQHQRKEKEDRLMKEAAAVIGMDEEDSEDNTERRLTQQSRPTRKASKKAIEELKRETQRMTRNMQLTHEARTKKKITKQSLFARFNYNPSTEVGEEMAERTVREEKTGSSDKGSDAEALHSTPPTSPPSFNGSPEKGKETFAAIAPFEKRKVVQENDVEEELPTMDDLITEQHAPRKRSQEKESSLNIGLVSLEAGVSKPTTTKERPRNLSSRRTLSKRSTAVDSESDLEVLPKGKKLSIWDRKPQQNQAHSASLQALRTLANLTSPSKQRARAKDMTLGELQTSLQQRARQQAKKERDERLQQLRDRGVIIQTAEERAKEEADVLDILARAREADSKLSKKEKAAAERDHDSGPKGDSDDEEEWNEGKSQTGTELSGDSETEGDGDDEDEEDDVEVGDLEEEEDLDQSPERNVPAMVDIQASEDDMDSADAPQDEDGDDNKFLDDGEKVVSSDARDQITVEKRKPRRALVLSDDEEDEMEVMTSNPKTTTTPVSVKKTTIPGLPTGDEVPLGLTQIFAGTMDESPTQEQLSQPPSRALDQEQDPLAFLRQLPDSDLPELDSRLDQDPHACVPDSQTRKDESQNQTESSRPDINLRDSQSQAGPLYVQDSFVLPSPSQYSEFPDPTQDVGFQNSSPIFDRFANPPTSTMDTVLLPADIPAPRKKSRLVKRAVIPDLSDDEIAARDVEPDNQDGEFLVSSDIFDVMRKAAEDKAKAPVEFNKKKSNAKGMVQEQAEESEDEYAGLGGASDDESGSEDAEFAREMVDDNGPDADERQLAAFYADKERAQDEKQVEKLYRDISNGLLRRKRGADYDLSDSDDEGEARRRRKQREFAKMRKALLEDEEIGKIATNPKRQAFLRSIEDREIDDDINFLEDEDAPFTIGGYSENVPESQEGLDSQDKAVPPPSIGTKRKHPEKHEETRLPPHLRRTKGSRPSTLAEIRASLSFLIAEPNANESTNTDLESSDIEIEEQEPSRDDHPEGEAQALTPNDSTFAKPHPRRSGSKTQVIDRLSLLRKSSSSLSTTGQTGPVAFAASSDAPLFRVPSLLRRATNSSTSSLMSTTTSTSGSASIGGTERAAGGCDDKPSIVKRGSASGKGSSVNFLQRESHKKGALEGVEKRRIDAVKKKRAERKGALSILGGSWG